MVDVISAQEFESRTDVDNVTDAYRQFRDQEGIPVHTGLYVDDWDELATSRWDRTGERGAFITLYGNEGVNDMQIHEIEPGGSTTEQHHLYETIVYVAAGSGLTVVGRGDDEVVFEWEKDALFFIPPCTPYRYLNATDDEPVRLIAETPLPQLLTMLKDERLIFEPGVDAWPRYREDGYFSAEANVVDSSHPDRPGGVISWVANFVPDMLHFDKMENHVARGAGGTSVLFPMPQSSMWAHISEFPTGTYKKAHRHHPGANVSILSGEGFSLLWEEGWEELVRIDWGPRSILTPPARWYHQHFNTGETAARYFAMHGPKLGTLEEANMFDYRNLANQIEYTEEDPTIRELYRSELADTGIEHRMPEECYTDPDYEFTLAD